MCVCGVQVGVQRPVSASGNNGWLGLFKVRPAFTPIGDAGTVNCQWCVSEGRSSTQQAATLCTCKELTELNKGDSGQDRKKWMSIFTAGPLTKLVKGPLR